MPPLDEADRERIAERCVVLKDGSVIEDGRHTELVGAGGRYSELYEM